MTIRVTHLLWLNEAPGRPPFSGAENHLFALLPGLVARGVDTELLVLLWQSGPLIESRLSKLQRQGVTVTQVQMETRPLWRWAGMRFPAHIARLRSLLIPRRRRIIHFHLDYFVFPVAIRAAGCRHVIASIHADADWLFRPHFRLWLKWMDRIVTHYIVISDHVRSFYKKAAFLSGENFTRIYYGYELKPLQQDAANIRPAHGIPTDSFVVGFAGRLTDQKNIPLLIEAARQIPEAHFVIIGDGELKSKLLAQADGLSNVQFLGFQSEAHEILAGLDVFCLPSVYEGLGLVLLEAMLRKVPIVASRAGAIPEVLQDGRFGILFESRNLSDLVGKIRYALNHPSELDRLAVQAYAYATQMFTVQKMFEETVKVYQRVQTEGCR